MDLKETLAEKLNVNAAQIELVDQFGQASSVPLFVNVRCQTQEEAQRAADALTAMIGEGGRPAMVMPSEYHQLARAFFADVQGALD